VWLPVDPGATIRGGSIHRIEPFDPAALVMGFLMKKKTDWNSEFFFFPECACYAQSGTPSMPFVAEILQSFDFL